MEKSRTDFMDSSFGDFFFFLSSPEQYSGLANVKPATEERNLKRANYEHVMNCKCGNRHSRTLSS